MTTEKYISHTCAVLLIVSSIALAFIQVLNIDDIAGGTLMYIAQAFLLAGSIFGLDYYLHKFSAYGHAQKTHKNGASRASSATASSSQQSAE